jgi:photosystem I P700 chlorophyll a apoprotein A1
MALNANFLLGHYLSLLPPYVFNASIPLFSYRLCNTVNSFLIGLVVGFVCWCRRSPIFMVRDYDPTNNYNNLLDRVIRQRDAMISH